MNDAGECPGERRIEDRIRAPVWEEAHHIGFVVVTDILETSVVQGVPRSRRSFAMSALPHRMANLRVLSAFGSAPPSTSTSANVRNPFWIST